MEVCHQTLFSWSLLSFPTSPQADVGILETLLSTDAVANPFLSMRFAPNSLNCKKVSLWKPIWKQDHLEFLWSGGPSVRINLPSGKGVLPLQELVFTSWLRKRGNEYSQNYITLGRALMSQNTLGTQKTWVWQSRLNLYLMLLLPFFPCHLWRFSETIL